MTDHHPVISGTVTKCGYDIWNDSTGEHIYWAGNHPNDSQTTSTHGLPIKTLEGMCDLTGEEIAKELGGYYSGHTVEED